MSDLLVLSVGFGLHLLWVGIAQFATNPSTRSLNWKKHLLLIFSVPLISVLSLWSTLEMGVFTAFCFSLMVGILLHQGLLVVLSPRHLVLWRLAWNNLVRRRRNTALMMIGLLVGAAMVSSSLVVGDSMDATISAEILLRSDTSDLQISGNDPLTGALRELNESRMRDFGELLFSDSESREHIDGFSISRKKSISVTNEVALLAEPDAHWWASDPTLDAAGGWSSIGGVSYSELAHEESVLGYPIFIINEVLADEVGAAAGDTLLISWSSYDGNYVRTDYSENVEIWKVVPMQGAAAIQGSKGGAIFSTLATAQTLQDAENKVNMVRISATGGVEDSLDAEALLYPHVSHLLDEVLVAEDAWLFSEGDLDLGIISLGKSSPTSRLSGEQVNDLRNNSVELLGESEITELLQAPLFGLRAPSGQVLTGLLSKDINAIIPDGSATWYIHSEGVSRESNLGAWDTWQVPNGTLVRDYQLLEDGLAIYHDDGAALLDENAEDLEVEQNNDNGTLLKLNVGFNDSFYSLFLLDSIPSVSDSLQTISPAAWNYEVQNAALYNTSEGLVTHLEGLLKVETWLFDGTWQLLADGPHDIAIIASQLFIDEGQGYTNLDNQTTADLGLPELEILSFSGSDLMLSDSSIWALSNNFTNTSITLDDKCDGNAFLRTEVLWCTTSFGVIVVENGESSIRLPTTAELEGLGKIPLLVIASNSNADLPAANETEVRLSSWANDALKGQDGVILVGAFSASRGNTTGILLAIGDEIPPIPTVPGQPGIADVIVGVVNFSVAERLASADFDERNLIMFSSSNLKQQFTMDAALENLQMWMDEEADQESAGITVNRVKKEGLENSKAASGSLSALFIVFGSFTMLAGMLLVVNIFVMLAEERKVEMGMIRALGLQRPDLRALFVLEGSLAAAISSIIGSILGLFIGWVVATGFAWALSSLDGAFVYAWTWSSVFTGAAVGFLVSWASLWATAMRNSRLNVVAAMRNLPPTSEDGPAWWSWLLLIGLTGSSLLCVAWFFLGARDSAFGHGLWNLSGILALLGGIPLLLYNLPSLLSNKFTLAAKLQRNSARNTMGALGISLILWVMLPDWIDPFRKDLLPNEFSFIVVGISSVAAGVMLLTSVAPMLASAVGRAATVTKRIGPIVPTALAYPLATPFRTALTLGMFSLTVFSVVVLAGYSSQFESYSESFVDDVSGDFDLLGTTSSWDRPLPLEGSPESWDWPADVQADDFDGIGVVSLGVVRYADAEDINADETEQVQLIRGIDSGFAEHGGLPLHIWDPAIGDDEKSAWQAVATNPNLAILDASFGMEFQGQVDESSPFYQLTFSIGDRILAIDPENPSISKEFTVVGFLDEGSLWSAPGIWVNHLSSAEEFGARYTRLYLSVPEGTSMQEKEDIVEAMERGFIDDGMEVQIIEVSVREFQSVLFGIFNIFQSYLMLGLVVGIAGLGIVTIRSVSERSHQTGILRAIGFQRRMVVAGYILELSWISLLGILNGVIIGIGFHWYLYDRFWRSEGVEFTMPWASIVSITLAAWLLVLLVTALPVRRAAAIRPAEALRELTS
ncbi:MAG: FtsX-like permease family protein [Candidatus Poseidoniales archaeon]|jgi:putative ABC transport system permease protein